MNNAGKRILILDDDSDMLEIITMMFSREHWIVDGANDGIEGCKMLAMRRYDAILSDVKMPNMNGLEFVAQVRISEKNRRTPIILMSGAYNHEDAERLAGFRISALLEKPITYQDFIKVYLKIQKLQAEIENMIGNRDSGFHEILDDIDDEN